MKHVCMPGVTYVMMGYGVVIRGEERDRSEATGPNGETFMVSFEFLFFFLQSFVFFCSLC